MIAQVETEGHILLENIRWETYERLLEEASETPIRFNYDNGTLEIMTLSFPHESYKTILARFVETLTEELNIPVRSGGSLTLKRKSRKKGMEADECWWITHEKQMRGKKKFNIKTDPPPDLGLEVDVSSSWLDRMAIAAALGIKEVWHFDGDTFRFFHLRGATYVEMERSALFPYLPKSEILRFLKLRDSTDETSLIRSFRQWVRETLVPIAQQLSSGGHGNSKGSAKHRRSNS